MSTRPSPVEVGDGDPSRFGPQEEAMSRRAFFSCSSMVRFQRSLVAVHSAPYWHRAPGAGGSHSAGSWSLA